MGEGGGGEGGVSEFVLSILTATLKWDSNVLKLINEIKVKTLNQSKCGRKSEVRV
jgi:hypothetical protein